MKKKWIILPLLAVVQTVAAQQQTTGETDLPAWESGTAEWETQVVNFPKHEIDIAIGMGDIDEKFEDTDDMLYGKGGYWLLGPMEKYNREKYSYRDVNAGISCIVSYRYGLNKHLYAGITAGYHPRNAYHTLLATGERAKERIRNSFIAMPTLRYYYYTHKKTRLYSELAGGISIDRCKEPEETQRKTKAKEAAQITLIGISIWTGQHSSMFFEAGAGDLGIFRGGIGIKLGNSVPHTTRVKAAGKQAGRHGINKRNGRPMRLF